MYSGENSKETVSRKDSGNSSRHSSTVDLKKDYGSQSKLVTSANARENTQKDHKTHSRQSSLTSVSSESLLARIRG
jgi:hypothetical protein